MTMIQYTIQIPEEAITDLESLMKKHGAHFDHRRQITAINDTFMESSTAMGHHLPALIESLNEHLNDRELSPPVPTETENWTPERIQAFLEMVVKNFHWVDSSVEDDWWEDDGKTWQMVVEENPLVFRKDS